MARSTITPENIKTAADKLVAKGMEARNLHVHSSMVDEFAAMAKEAGLKTCKSGNPNRDIWFVSGVPTAKTNAARAKASKAQSNQTKRTWLKRQADGIEYLEASDDEAIAIWYDDTNSAWTLFGDWIVIERFKELEKAKAHADREMPFQPNRPKNKAMVIEIADQAVI